VVERVAVPLAHHPGVGKAEAAGERKGFRDGRWEVHIVRHEDVRAGGTATDQF